MLAWVEELVIRVLVLDTTVLGRLLAEAEAGLVMDLPVVRGVVIAEVGVTSVALAVVGVAIGSSRPPGRGTARVGVSNGAGSSI